jgi:imidazolonepropionase-like amidohydrolase
MLTDTDDSHYDDILLKQSRQYRTILATLNVKRDLEAGFTAMRDVETEGAMYSDVDVRNAINQGLIPGPRLKVATRGISTTGGYGLEGYSPEVTVPTCPGSPSSTSSRERWIENEGTTRALFLERSALYVPFDPLNGSVCR